MPLIPGVVATAAGIFPGAPIIGTATKSGTRAAIVNFTAPAHLGKPSGTTYTARAWKSDGSSTAFSASGATSPLTISSMSYSTTFYFTVELANTVGTGRLSASSNTITTSAAPPAFTPSFTAPPPTFTPPPPAFKPTFCISSNSRVLTKYGYFKAQDIKIGDRLLTVDPINLTDTDTFSNATISNNVKFVETEVVKNEVSKKTLIKFNDILEMFSLGQPIFIKDGEGIKYKETKDIVIGDILVNIDSESGNVSYVPVEKIEILPEEDVYEIRTTPLAWFIVGNYLAIA